MKKAVFQLQFTKICLKMNSTQTLTLFYYMPHKESKICSNYNYSSLSIRREKTFYHKYSRGWISMQSFIFNLIRSKLALKNEFDIAFRYWYLLMIRFSFSFNPSSAWKTPLKEKMDTPFLWNLYTLPSSSSLKIRRKPSKKLKIINKIMSLWTFFI